MRVLVSGGGTGGHVYPALSVATQLRDSHGADILYLGSDDGLETDLVPAAGFRFKAVKAGKLQRFVSWRTVTGVARVPVGMGQAVGIVREFRPDVAFTSGGYVAVPAGLAARINGVPFLMHQQDVPPNLSNRLLTPLATRISVAFADSLAYFPAKKTVQLGNPVRQAILDIRQVAPQQARKHLGFDPELPLLLVTGGSQGARHLNQMVCSALPGLLKYCQVLQISGKKLFNETQELSEQMLASSDDEKKSDGEMQGLRQRYRLVPYLSDEMPMALQAASMVICRAGAATLSELAVLGKPSILVPLPPGFGGSPQEVNADMFAKHRAALTIRNDDLTPEKVLERVKEYILSDSHMEGMSQAARALAKPDATQEIVEAILDIAKKRVLWPVG